MNFKFSDEQQLLQEMFREFAQSYIKPEAAALDEEEHFPEEMIGQMGEVGIMGVMVPEAYGGTEMGCFENVIAIEEISKVCASTAAAVLVHSALCCYPLIHYGTEQQKEKYLPGLAAGESLGAFALTEPGTGSDSAGVKMSAQETEDGYLLNGSKVFITNGSYADVYIVVARTDKADKHNGLSAFIVEKGSEGFSFGTKEKKMGIRGSATYELIFNDCRIPKENLLGAPGQGFEIAMKALDCCRIGIAAQAVGIAQGAIDETIPYVQQREQFGQPVSSFQNTQFTLAEMQTEAAAARNLVYEAACALDEGEDVSDKAAMAKLFASKTATAVTHKCLQLFGGYGYTREYPLERLLRDAIITELYGGTNEVQKMIVARGMGVK